MNSSEKTKNQTERVERITGLWWCSSGHHQARGEPHLHNGRKICAGCKQRINRSMKR